jgi:hypothetical protein
MSKTFKITLQLWFNQSELDYDADSDSNDPIPGLDLPSGPPIPTLKELFEEMKAKKKLMAPADFEKMEADGFDPEEHFKKYDINEIIECIVFDEGTIKSAKWLEDMKLEFVYEFYEEKTAEEILKNLMMNSLEDAAYEGDSGLVVYTENEFEYGLFDYRNEENIIIEAL